MRYLFKHILLRDAAYGIQMGAQLQRLHRRAARAIEAMYADDLVPYYADLAYHYHKAQDIERAAHYAIEAGQKAYATSAYREAQSLFERALALLPSPHPARVPLIIQAGETLMRISDFAQARQYLEAGLTEARAIEDFKSCAEALAHLGWIARAQGAHQQAYTHLQESLALGHRVGDQALVAHTLNELGWINYRLGNFPEARANFITGQALLQQLDDPLCLGRVLNGLGAVAEAQGEYDEARKYRLESLSVCREAGHRHGMGVALANLGETARLQGNYATARRYYQESLNIFWAINARFNAVIVISNLGHVAVALGEYEGAKHYYYEGLHLSQQLEAVPEMLDSLAGLANALAHTGETERAAELVGLVTQHPALWDEAKPMIEATVQCLHAHDAAASVEAHMARGAQHDLDAVVREILQEQAV